MSGGDVSSLGEQSIDGRESGGETNFEIVDAPAAFKPEVRKHFRFPCVRKCKRRKGDGQTN